MKNFEKENEKSINYLKDNCCYNCFLGRTVKDKHFGYFIHCYLKSESKLPSDFCDRFIRIKKEKK